MAKDTNACNILWTSNFDGLIIARDDRGGNSVAITEAMSSSVSKDVALAMHGLNDHTTQC